VLIAAAKLNVLAPPPFFPGYLGLPSVASGVCFVLRRDRRDIGPHQFSFHFYARPGT